MTYAKYLRLKQKRKKTALILFREALSSNNLYLSFLFYWQVLEVANTRASNWVDEVFNNKELYNRLLVGDSHIKDLSLNNKSLGQYLYDDCRNAIAHIKRSPGRPKIKLDSPEDILKMAISTDIVKKFAKFYIEDKLQLNRGLYLVRKKGTGFPVFVNEEYMKQNDCDIAYKYESLPPRNKRWYYKSKKNSSLKQPPYM